jgi:hypothetical protein
MNGNEAVKMAGQIGPPKAFDCEPVIVLASLRASPFKNFGSPEFSSLFMGTNKKGNDVIKMAVMLSGKISRYSEGRMRYRRKTYEVFKTS